MMSSSSVDITYVPADCGSVIPGKSKAPAAFREVGIVDKLRAAGVSSITEHQALESPAAYRALPFEVGRVRNEDLNVLVCQRVKGTIGKNLSTKPTSSEPSSSPAGENGISAFQLIIGGECGMLPGILSAFWQHADSQTPPLRVGLIYIDADTDLASPTDPTSTGIFAGMNMTHLIQAQGTLQSMQQFNRPSTGGAVCTAANTVLFGVNMTAPGNKREHLAYLFDNNFKVITSRSVAEDAELHAEKALVHLKEQADLIMVHLDVDSIDPQMFPLANVPNFTGVTFDCMMRALRVLLASDKVVGLTVAEVNPDHDPDREMLTRLTDQIVEMIASKVRLS